MDYNIEKIEDIKFEDIELNEDLKKEVEELETELSGCGHDCYGDSPD